MTQHRNAATYKDIQRLTGLSLATISKHFNGGNVLDANRDAIETAADALGFRVNTYASSLRSGVSRTVGVLLPSLQNTFHLSVIVGVEKFLRAQGISVLVSSNEGDSEDRAGDALDALLGRRVDGIVSVPAAHDVPALSRAIAAGVPVVTVDWWEKDLQADSVSLDNFGAGEIVGQHIVDHGHDRIGVLAGEESISTMRERREGFAAALVAAGRDLPSGFVQHGPLTVESGYRGTTALLGSHPRPTAIFASNYDLTLGALIAINESGLRLGVDISVVGFDSVELAQVTRPRLTILAQPIDEIARTAAEIISSRLSGSEAREYPLTKRRLPGSLVVGASVASIHDVT